MQSYLTDKILFPPSHYSNNDIHMNILPQKWFQMLSNDRTPLIQDPRDFTGADPQLDETRNLAGERPQTKQIGEKPTFSKRFANVVSKVLSRNISSRGSGGSNKALDTSSLQGAPTGLKRQSSLQSQRNVKKQLQRQLSDKPGEKASKKKEGVKLPLIPLSGK